MTNVRYRTAVTEPIPKESVAFWPQERLQDLFEDMLAWKEGRLNSNLNEATWQDTWDRFAGTQFVLWLILRSRRQMGIAE